MILMIMMIMIMIMILIVAVIVVVIISVVVAGVRGMVHIKEPLLLIGKSSLCGGSEFPLFLTEWFVTICN